MLLFPRLALLRAANQISSWHEVLQGRYAGFYLSEKETALAEPLPADVALVRLSFLVQSVYAEICLKHDLSPAQAQLLCVIKDQPRGMTELTRILRQERPGLSGLVDRIERRGLLRRSTPEHDRRAVTLTPTTRGQQVAEAFYAEVSDRLLEAIAHLPAKDRRQFERIATSIVHTKCVPVVFGAPTSQPTTS
jgi:DNA-binding MarR family transcriptional regulator